MLKNITCAALAAVSLCAFAQSNYDQGQSKMGIYYSDTDRMANPPAASKNTASYGDMQWNLMHQAEWLHGADRYDLYAILDNSTGEIQNCLLQSLYNIRCEAELARHDIMAQDCASFEVMASSPMPGYTYFFAEDAPTAITAQTNTGDFVDVTNRPMRMALNQPRVPDISYEDAASIIEHELNSSAATNFDDWFWHTATEQNRDTLVRVLRADTWVKNQPIYVSTLTPTWRTPAGH
jgi:hypothetical protein